MDPTLTLVREPDLEQLLVQMYAGRCSDDDRGRINQLLRTHEHATGKHHHPFQGIGMAQLVGIRLGSIALTMLCGAGHTQPLVAQTAPDGRRPVIDAMQLLPTGNATQPKLDAHNNKITLTLKNGRWIRPCPRFARVPERSSRTENS